MDNHGYMQKGNLALVNPLQAHGTVVPDAPENLGPRVLELASLLQTTLELERQIELFGKEAQRHLAVDGLVYTMPDAQQRILFGREDSQRATYDLKLEESSLGAITVCRELPLSPREIRSLENLLCALVYPLRNALTYRKAVEMAMRDPLTGVHNRIALDSALAREVDLAKRQGIPLSMLVLDIDHFKVFNDEFGHSFGDEVLTAVSQTITNAIRRSDLLFRFGGEEFIVLASHTAEEGAMLLAERIRQNIAALDQVRGQSCRVTISIGVARLSPEEDKDRFFERADAALYRAKREGRNCSRLG